MTQQGLATALGVTQQAVSAWLKGLTKPSSERISKIEELLGIPASDWAAVGADDPDESGPSLAVADPDDDEHVPPIRNGTEG